MVSSENVTEWLALWREGDDQALARVTEAVYKDLRRMAAYCLAGESSSTLSATALVHEAYLRVSSIRGLDWKDRKHFVAMLAQIMRRILVDHARRRKSLKRDSSKAGPVPEATTDPSPIDILLVDDALNQMIDRYPRCAQVVELHFFGDLEFGEIAEIMDISLSTVERDWRFSRAWLQAKLQ